MRSTIVTSIAIASAIASLTGAVGCGGDDGPCDFTKGTGCDDGQACERVQDSEETVCAMPVVVTGRVFDLETNAGIAGVRILGIDANNSAISFVAVSDASGNYELGIPTLRTADGAPTAIPTITLRADASGYLTFPSGIRPALPIDTSSPVEQDGKLVIASALTSIGLLPMPAGGPATGTVRGRITENPTGASVLVVAEVGGKGFTAYADRDGDYTIFNVPEGDAQVAAYARGHNYERGAATVVAGKEVEVDLALSEEPTSAVSGTVQFVNPEAGQATSVILVVESTFNAMLARGETPPGLRAPDPGLAPNVTSTFSITGVPAGRYVVLAGFENDNMVRDESGIGGTAIVHQEVVAGQDVAIGASFKVTGSVDLVSPGANGPEMVTGAPMFKWVDDASEDMYEVTVLDSYGNAVWTGMAPRNASSLAYGGPALESGMYYQYRVRSIMNGTTIARSEDLKGLFYLP